MLRAHGVRFGLENHPEQTPSEVLEAIGDDTTCSAQRSTPAGGRPRATTRSPRSDELSDRLFHVHLKDVEAAGHARHVHARRGLRAASPTASRRCSTIGYAGPVSIEHHPFDRDPTAECARMLVA